MGSADGDSAGAAQPLPTPIATSSSHGAAADTPSSLSPTRPPYIPQFTAATQMILKRMKGEPSSFGPALSSMPIETKPEIKASTYEDVRRRLVMGMSTTASMTMEMPAPPTASNSLPTTSAEPSPTIRRSTAKTGMSAIRRISSGLTASGRSTGARPPASKGASAGGKTKVPKTTTASQVGTKRKRGPKKQDDDDDASNSGSSSSLSSLSGMASSKDTPKEKGTTPPPPPAPTMTKSGRQVQKPSTYNPAATDASSGRKRAHHHLHHSKARTAEHALCKRCTRMHSPASNQMVFCDGCNDGWHQMCHDPWIEDDVVRDVSRAWFCADCQARRDRHFAKRQQRATGAGSARESWAGRTPQQRRAYLSTLSQQELVGLLMHSLDAHPDLPIFPASEGALVGSPHGEAPSGPTGVARKASGSAGRSPPGKGRAAAAAAASGGHNSPKGTSRSGGGQDKKQDDDDDFDPLAPPWPEPGKGLYSLLPPDDEDDEHLVDDDDYEAFSVIIYDENGKKIEENGIKV